MRKFAIIYKDEHDVNENIIKMLGENEDITVFTTEERKITFPSNVKVVKIPDTLKDSNSKIKNFVTSSFFTQGYKGFLHVIEDSVRIYNSPSSFMDEIEKMMKVFKLKHWFNTVTDPCNYTFKIYNPRFSVALDTDDTKDKYGKTIYFTSHSNTSWICYDYEIATMEDVSFDENFTIAMYYIIKFLAEKRNNKKVGELYYMNFYPTIKEELNVFDLVSETNVKVKTEEDIKKDQETMKKEGEIYGNMHINNNADVSIEAVMDDVYELVKNF